MKKQFKKVMAILLVVASVSQTVPVKSLAKEKEYAGNAFTEAP